MKNKQTNKQTKKQKQKTKKKVKKKDENIKQHFFITGQYAFGMELVLLLKLNLTMRVFLRTFSVADR